MPFSPDPVSFSGYLSYTNWGDPSKTIRFEHLGNCSYDYSYGTETYKCDTGYAFIKDAYKTEKCRIDAWYDGKNSYYRKLECRDVPIPERAARKTVTAPATPSTRIKKAFDSLFGY